MALSQASHIGTRGGIVVDGLDAVVRDFTRKAATLQVEAGREVVRHADRAAQRMRNTVPIGPPELHVLDSITADQRPSIDPTVGIYADCGPDPAANAGAFVARFLERGTVHMEPRPFVGPAADQTLPEFERAIGRLGDL